MATKKKTTKAIEAAHAPATPVVIGYKGFDTDLKCRGFGYEVGKSYEHDGPVKACKSGFHACENPLDVFSYYGPVDARFCLVEMSGELSRRSEDSKIASAKITIKAEIGLPQIIADSVKWIMALCKASALGAEAASGDYSQLAASGDYSQLAASGDYSQLAASGDYSQLAASGDYSKLAASGDSSKLAASGDSSKLAASGDYSQLAASGDSSKLAASGYSSKLAASGDSSKLAASGDSSQLAASGKKSVACAAAPNCTASAGELGCIVLTRWVGIENRYRVSVGYVGENGIKPNVIYKIGSAGEFVEVE
jgi:hypothetical protein